MSAAHQHRISLSVFYPATPSPVVDMRDNIVLISDVEYLMMEFRRVYPGYRIDNHFISNEEGIIFFTAPHGYYLIVDYEYEMKVFRIVKDARDGLRAENVACYVTAPDITNLVLLDYFKYDIDMRYYAQIIFPVDDNMNDMDNSQVNLGMMILKLQERPEMARCCPLKYLTVKFCTMVLIYNPRFLEYMPDRYQSRLDYNG